MPEHLHDVGPDGESWWCRQRREYGRGACFGPEPAARSAATGGTMTDSVTNLIAQARAFLRRWDGGMMDAQDIEAFHHVEALANALEQREAEHKKSIAAGMAAVKAVEQRLAKAEADAAAMREVASGAGEALLARLKASEEVCEQSERLFGRTNLAPASMRKWRALKDKEGKA